MSEYWISQGRKMCTYCKCWIADNKASINFHEQGKNHKENVKKKLDELRKKSISDAKKKQTEITDMARIEKAALEALKKDLTANPVLSGAYGIKDTQIESAKKAIDAKLKTAFNDIPATTKAPSGHKHKSKGKKKFFRNQNAASTTAETSANSIEEPEANSQEGPDSSSDEEPGVGENCSHYSGDWYTAVNDEGYTYYWNVSTNETSWNPPDAEANSSTGVSQSGESTTQISTAAENPQDSNSTEPNKEESSTITGKEASSEVPQKDLPPNKLIINVGKRANPYGEWQTVKDEQTVLPDLQLPNDISNFEVLTDDIPLPEPPSQPEIREKKFKEKEVILHTKSNEANVAFKKRKIGANRQARKQEEDNL